MKIVPLSKEAYGDWDAFCMQSDDAWFWHTTEMAEYSLSYNPQLESKPLYFFVKEKNEMLAIVPLFSETKIFRDKRCKEFSFGGGALPMPALSNTLDKKTRSKVLDLAFGHIDGLAMQQDVLRASYKFSPLARSFIESEHPMPNYLTRYSFIDVSLPTRLIDLQKTEEELWEDMRRNHRRGIEEIKGRFEVIVYDKENITHEVFDEYRLAHKKAAGRATRPLITFEKMYQWIKDGSAILVASKDKEKNRYAGFEHYSIYKDNVYGFSAANDPEYARLPVRHQIEWEAMLWLKRKGCKYYEIGQEYYGPHLHHFQSEKEVNISLFKQGFGGFAVPFFVGEKYYSQDYFLHTLNERVADFASKYDWETKATPAGSGETKPGRKPPRPAQAYGRDELEKMVKAIIRENENILKEYAEGKTSVVNYVIGKIKRKAGKGDKYIDYKFVSEIFRKEAGVH